MTMRPISVLLFVLASPSFAQNQDIQKHLIQRQQQSDAFALQLRHSQELVKVLPGKKQELEARQFSERLRLENVSERQLSNVQVDTPQELRPQERQRAEDERRPIVAPQ